MIDRVTLIYGFSGHGCNADGTRWGIYISPGNQVQGGWEWDLERTGGLSRFRALVAVGDPGSIWAKIADGPADAEGHGSKL